MVDRDYTEDLILEELAHYVLYRAVLAELRMVTFFRRQRENA
jgi:hypothetical protein